MNSLTEQEELMISESMRMWNSRADDYYEYAKTVMKDDNIDSPSKFVLDNMKLNKNSKVLDVGCGTAHYDVNLAKRVKYVKAIDISENMLKYANKIAKEANVDNVDFELIPWQKLNLKEKSWEKEFDLVFATTTPAINTFEDLQKMCDASRKYCFFSGLFKTEEKYRTYVQKNIINSKSIVYEKEAKEYFDYLWDKGFYPSMCFRKMQWESILSVEQCIDELIAYEGYDVISRKYEEIKAYYEKISNNGKVNSSTNAVAFWIYWTV